MMMPFISNNHVTRLVLHSHVSRFLFSSSCIADKYAWADIHVYQFIFVYAFMFLRLRMILSTCIRAQSLSAYSYAYEWCMRPSASINSWSDSHLYPDIFRLFTYYLLTILRGSIIVSESR
jgi:hypothetical protein